MGTETLRDGTEVQAPMDGYQIVPIQKVSTGAGSEDAAWLQGTSDCANAIISSDQYFDSKEYADLLSATNEFYESVAPMVNETFSSDKINYKNAYSSRPSVPIEFGLLTELTRNTVFDHLNVASIHNATFTSSSLLTDSTLARLRTLADTHEFGLAYNSSDTIRAVSGATLAARIVESLNGTIASGGEKTKLTVEFGAYATFLSFFGLAGLPGTSADFYGVPDYASAMAFELFTEAEADADDGFPAERDLRVRFSFANGTAGASAEPRVFPLFGGGEDALSWTDFAAGMAEFAVNERMDWCTKCGNRTGVCVDAAGGAASADYSSGGNGGLSLPAAGVIGAMVTLAVILGVEALVVLLGGWRLVSKKRLAGAVLPEKA